MLKKSQTSHGWWFNRHHNTNTNRSLWFQSTLTELEQRTQAVLKLIEQDGDSFAQRAEMYYENRPQLICIIEELYRTHRALLEQYNQLRINPATSHRLLLPKSSSPFSSPTKNQPEDNKSTSLELKYYAYSETSFESDFEHEDAAESEVDDPEPDNEVLDCNEIEEIEEERVLGTIDTNYARNLREEVERLRRENEIQKEELKEKDEEKKEVIRQLSLAVNILKDDNARLMKSARNGRFKGTFLGKLFRSF